MPAIEQILNAYNERQSDQVEGFTSLSPEEAEEYAALLERIQVAFDQLVKDRPTTNHPELLRSMPIYEPINIGEHAVIIGQELAMVEILVEPSKLTNAAISKDETHQAIRLKLNFLAPYPGSSPPYGKTNSLTFELVELDLIKVASKRDLKEAKRFEEILNELLVINAR